MANQFYRSQFFYSFDVKPVLLKARVTIGAAGAPTKDAANSPGLATITRLAAGTYRLTLSKPYKVLRSLSVVPDTSGAGGAVPAAPMLAIKAQNVNLAGGGTIDFMVGVGSPFVATDPANGEALYIEVSLNDSSVRY